MKRIVVILEPGLHGGFKAACRVYGESMVGAIERMVEDYVSEYVKEYGNGDGKGEGVRD